MKPRVDRKRPSLIGGTVGAKNTNETKKLAPKFKFFSPPEFFAFVAAWDQFDEIDIVRNGTKCFGSKLALVYNECKVLL